MAKKAEAKTTPREVAELKLLFEISQALNRELELRRVVDPVLDAMAEHMGMVRGTITLLNRQTGEISTDAAHGLSDRQRQRGRYRLGEGVVGRVIDSGHPAVVARISEEPLFLDRTGARRDLRKQDISFICVPIKIGREVVGALSADRLFDEKVSLEEDLRLLSIIASMIAQAVRLRQAAQEEQERLLAENVRLQQELAERFRPDNLIGNSGAMQAVYDLIAQVAGSDATVLIVGESGTGKELVARAIHYNSPRAQKRIVAVHCASMVGSLMASELFGHEKGAFTGADRQRQGRFERAEGGTLFLDEVGDLNLETQVRLLRVLQEREFERVGGSETLRADVRVIAATNRALEDLIAAGTFREDLYYRLNVFPIHIPPLRERRSDILLLADHFAELYGARNHKPIARISTPAIDCLMAYHWPGNVRELENCIERAVLLVEGDTIHAHHLPPTLQLPETPRRRKGGLLQTTLDNIERDLIMDALKSSRGNKAAAARALGLSERLMGLRVARHGIDPRRFRVKAE